MRQISDEVPALEVVAIKISYEQALGMSEGISIEKRRIRAAKTVDLLPTAS